MTLFAPMYASLLAASDRLRSSRARFARAVKAAGLRLYVWTVDDPAQAVRFGRMGADGITTNRPHELRRRTTPAAAMSAVAGLTGMDPTRV